MAGAVHPATPGCADLQLAELRHSGSAALLCGACYLTLVEEEGDVRLCLRGACGAGGLQLSEQLSMSDWLMLEGVSKQVNPSACTVMEQLQGPKDCRKARQRSLQVPQHHRLVLMQGPCVMQHGMQMLFVLSHSAQHCTGDVGAHIIMLLW